MGPLSWIVVGLIAGGLGRRAVGAQKRGCLATMVIGILGGLIGGALSSAAGGDGIGDFGLRSLIVAFVGACLLLFILQAIDRN